MSDSSMMLDKVEVNTNPKYSDLVQEAFIDPIRNITVIDDDYPTLSCLLNSQIGGNSVANNKLKPENVARLKKIIELCHKEKSWSVDVFDGTAPTWGEDNDIPPYLNHSDLIVLDYHLDGNTPTDKGSRARKIIREMESNNHFNIILVHTNGYDTGGIELVFDEILKELLPAPKENPFSVSDEIDDAINDWLDSGNSSFLLDMNFGLKQILKLLITDDRTIVNFNNPVHIFHGHKEELLVLSNDINIQANDLVKWIFNESYKTVLNELQGGARGTVKWDWLDDTKPNFIATGRVFISVIKKNNGSPEEELLIPLKESLNKLNASPMHLLMAKIRNDIDDRGLEQANLIVGDLRAQSGWLYNLLERAEYNSFEHDKIIDLHWEQLARSTKHELREFSKKIVSATKSDPRWNGNSKEIVKSFFEGCAKDPQLTLGHLNALSCSQPVLESHLSTGTILFVDGDYWVCLTPACDLVPKQRLSQWESRIGKNHLVFKAAKLCACTLLKTANSKANTNEYIYLNLNGEPKAFSLTNGDSNGNPEWEVFYAESQGVYDKGNILTVLCLREQVLSEVGKETSSALVATKFDAKAVAELRYEYALNLMHKFGANQTRVGLGFVDPNNFFS